MRHSANIRLLLVHHLRRWRNNNLILGKCFVFVGTCGGFVIARVRSLVDTSSDIKMVGDTRIYLLEVMWKN